MSWFAGLKMIHQFLITAAGILAIISAGMATAAGFSVRVLRDMVRDIVREEVEPVRDMSEYNLRVSGKWDDFIREREKADRDRKIINSRGPSTSLRISSAGYPIFRDN